MRTKLGRANFAPRLASKYLCRGRGRLPAHTGTKNVIQPALADWINRLRESQF
ncbi:hypothetical protein HMPREF3198_00901 [Winkia neuii]|nr:hypothetical protein HMPREF3198_00901 [Winkia neuii]